MKQQRAADSLARKKWKIPWNFLFALESGSACGPSNVFLFTKIFHTFFTVLPEGFCTFFHDFFAHFFALFFARLFSQNFFAHPFYVFFWHIFFIAVCCPRVFIVQSQHCVTVPETGHTTTCRSSPSLLTQYSHKQVEKIKSFWKDKRQILTLLTILHKIQLRSWSRSRSPLRSRDPVH